MVQPYKAPAVRVLSFGSCLWCDAPLRAKKTKPPKYCGDACRKNHQRRDKLENLLESVVASYHRKQERYYKKEAVKAPKGRLCRTPKSRSEFDSAFGLCARPQQEVDSQLGVLSPEPIVFGRRYTSPVNPHAHPAPIGPRLKDGFFFKVETRRVRKVTA